MTKKDMAKLIAEEMGMIQAQTQKIVQRVFDGIIDTLVDEGRMELRNFGVFEVKKRKARQARNPRTGEKVVVPGRAVVTFKPGLQMEERVRQSHRPAASSRVQPGWQGPCYSSLRCRQSAVVELLEVADMMPPKIREIDPSYVMPQRASHSMAWVSCSAGLGGTHLRGVSGTKATVACSN
jgi:nucleoid DNA-binding protein